jgi:3-hydroxy-5-methyl-1-naphthoate 3-O-methyltransferase
MTTPVTPERIQQYAWGYAPPLILEAAVKHQIFDLLDAGAKTVPEVAKETGTSTRGLAAILNALVGLELLTKDGDGRYSLTPESSAFLVSSKPGFVGGMIRHTSEDLIPRWLRLTEVVKTGKPVSAVNQQTGGSEFFEHFVNDIFPLSYPSAQALARYLDCNVEGHRIKVLDLAAGSGVWGIAQAQCSDAVYVTAVDWPGVLPATRKTVAKFGLSERFNFIEGDLAEAEFGSGYDVAILGHILHSEGEERSRALLKKTCQALKSGGTIAIAEFLVNAERTGPPMPLLFAVNMLVGTDVGNTFSFEEIAGWLGEAGFVKPRTVDCPGPSPLVLATKP